MFVVLTPEKRGKKEVLPFKAVITADCDAAPRLPRGGRGRAWCGLPSCPAGRTHGPEDEFNFAVVFSVGMCSHPEMSFSPQPRATWVPVLLVLSLCFKAVRIGGLGCTPFVASVRVA